MVSSLYNDFFNTDTTLHRVDHAPHHLLPESILNREDLYGQTDNHHSVLTAGPGLSDSVSYTQTRLWYYKSDAAKLRIELCGLSFPSIRQFAAFHYFQLFSHTLVLFNALSSAILTLIDSDQSIFSRITHMLFILSMVFVDLWMSLLYYHKRQYAPYSLSSPLLYIFQSVIVPPRCPDVIFFSDKLGLLCQGYLFVVLPYLNILTLIYTPDESAQQRSFNKIISFLFGNNDNNTPNNSFQHDLVMQIKLIFIYIILFQLCITLYSFLSFALFYTVFVYELILRVLLFPFCCFRSRKYTKIVSNEQQPLLSPPHQLKFITHNVYHNYYTYQQHQINLLSYNQQQAVNNYNSFNTHSNDGTSQARTTSSTPFADAFEVVELIDQDPNRDTLLPYPAQNRNGQHCHIQQFAIDQQEFIPITPYHDHLFASNISDPIFYKPYEILWGFM